MQEKKITFSVQLEFHGTDLQWAREWARSHGYAYDDDHHVLFDAMLDGRVQPLCFREVVSFGSAK